jgi:hypothetical protein
MGGPRSALDEEPAREIVPRDDFRSRLPHGGARVALWMGGIIVLKLRRMSNEKMRSTVRLTTKSIMERLSMRKEISYGVASAVSARTQARLESRRVAGPVSCGAIAQARSRAQRRTNERHASDPVPNAEEPIVARIDHAAERLPLLGRQGLHPAFGPVVPRVEFGRAFFRLLFRLEARAHCTAERPSGCHLRPGPVTRDVKRLDRGVPLAKELRRVDLRFSTAFGFNSA